jgi:hypothetical protein
MGGEEPACAFSRITVEDVLNSRMIAYPFAYCVLPMTDGGGALILVAAERARASRRNRSLLGTGESVETPRGQMEDFTSSPCVPVSPAPSLAESHTHNDVII